MSRRAEGRPIEASEEMCLPAEPDLSDEPGRPAAGALAHGYGVAWSGGRRHSQRICNLDGPAAVETRSGGYDSLTLRRITHQSAYWIPVVRDNR